MSDPTELCYEAGVRWNWSRDEHVATVERRLQSGGFAHDQAAILAEVLHDEVTHQIAKDHVDLVVDRASERLEKMIHMESKSTIKWLRE